ncbi:hypothetical protein ABZ639_04825 [Saccharomonospora sp. NPDC006951]
METSPEGNRSRWRVDPEKVTWFENREGEFFPGEQLAALAEDARSRRMARHEYYLWICRMSDRELHAYRDRVMAGEGGRSFALVYNAWLTVRSVVRDVQILFRGLPGEPDQWA